MLVFPGGLYTSTDLQIEGDTNLRVRLVGRCRLGTCGELAPTDGDQNVTLPAGTEAIVIDTAGEWNLLPESVSGEDTAEVLPETVHG